MRCTVETVIPHTGANKWRAVGETYPLTKQYADIMVAIGKVKIVGVATTGRGSIQAAMPVLSGLAEMASVADAVEQSLAAVAEPLPLDEEALRKEYEALFGVKAHHKKKAETIAEEIAAKKAEEGGQS